MSRFILAALLLVGGLSLPAGHAFAQGANGADLRRAEAEYTTLRVRLQSLNAEIADLKRAERSVRNDYRLHDRQAEAEAMAQKLTQVEGKIRGLGGHVAGEKPAPVPVATPRTTGDENSFEREAKADLLADQSMRLVREAERLQQAAAELRARLSLRKQAGRWDRDPFAGMESPKRTLSVSTSSRGTLAVDSSTAPGFRGPTTTTVATPGGTASGAPTTNDTGTKGAPTTAPSTSGGAGVAATPPTGITSGGTAIAGGSTESTYAASAASAASAKGAPTLLTSPLSERFDQRVFLDPATAAQIRTMLGSESARSDPEALLRAAELLRARARLLNQEEQSLRGRGPSPR